MLRQEGQSQLKARQGDEWSTLPRHNRIMNVDGLLPLNKSIKAISDDKLRR